MSPGPTFERVYTALKARLVQGDFAPGEHLEPALLGEELFSSATPVRDVLHRLVGERLVDATRADGFRVPAPSEAELRGLYGWRNVLLGLALKEQAGPRGAVSSALFVSGSTEVPAGEPEELFLFIARRTPQRELEASIISANERLGLLRHAERQLLGDAPQDVAQIGLSFAEADWSMVRRTVAAFHRTRQRHVPALLETAWLIAHNRQTGSV